MLYVTTRDDRDAFTAHRVLHENTAPDGGAYIPFCMPTFSRDEIVEYAASGFSETVAAVLNRFFSSHLTGWDVDFCIGRNAVNLVPMSHRILVAELWHNPDGAYSHICYSLFKKICGTESGKATEWFLLATHIGILFGIYSEMCRAGVVSPGEMVEITVTEEDLSLPVAAVYAHQMGLPIEMIILTSDENSALWDLICQGELNSPLDSVSAVYYERLIHAILGKNSVTALQDALRCGKTFYVDEEQLALFNQLLFCAVTGKDRSSQNVNSIYRSNSYIIDPTAALSVGGLQDFRAKTGVSKMSLVLSCTSPMNCIPQICDATGIAKEKLLQFLKTPRNG